MLLRAQLNSTFSIEPKNAQLTTIGTYRFIRAVGSWIVFNLTLSVWIRRNAVLSMVTMMVCFAGVIVILMRIINAQHLVTEVLKWIEAQGVWAPIFLALFQWICVVALAPDLFIGFIAGYLLGFWLGLASIALGTTLGAVSAFLLARFALSGRVKAWRESYPKFALLERGFAEDGLKITMLRCMVPFFPFKVSNYAFGASSLPIWQFAGGTFLGILPLAAVSVYLGSISANLTIIHHGWDQKGPLEWGALAIGGVILVVFAIYVMRRARKILADYEVNGTAAEQTSCG